MSSPNLGLLRYTECHDKEQAKLDEDAGTRTNSLANAKEVEVQQSIYLSWIKDQMDSESACLELPFTIILLASFSVLAVMHLRQDIVFSVEQAIEQDVLENANFAFSHAFGHKGIFDVHSIPDFWSWVRLGFIPLVVQPVWSYSEDYGAGAEALFGYEASPESSYKISGQPKSIPVTGDYLHYNRIIGGLRFRQELAPMSEKLCKFPTSANPDVWNQWYGKPCSPAIGELAFSATSPDADSGIEHPERIEWMYTDIDTLETFIAQAVDMEDGCSQMTAKNRTACLCQWCYQQTPNIPWLTEQTQRIEISMATYNAEYGLISMTGVNFFFNRGSLIHKRVEIMSSWMDPFAMPIQDLILVGICDFLWVGMLFYTAVGEAKEIWHVMMTGEGRWWNSLRQEYLAFWNVVDWLSIIVALIVVIYFSQLVALSLTCHEALRVLVEAPKDHRDAYASLVEAFYVALEAVCSKEKNFRQQMCFYPILVNLRLFKSFAAQPRLAMVTETLAEAKQDMIHFGIVFMAVACCLCLNAVLLFGQDLEAFATFPRALHSCFRMMFGDWDWQPMEEVRRNLAMMWFALFILLIVVILLNMLLAIIMDNYMNVKKRTMNAISLPDQVKAMYRRYNQNKRRERVKLGEIWDTFVKQDGNEKAALNSTALITASLLQDTVADIPMDQAQRTLNNSLDTHKKATTEPFKIEDTCDTLHVMDKETQMVRDMLFHAYDRADYYDTMLSDKEREASDMDDAMASLVAMEAEAATEDPAISGQVLDFVESEIQRLSAETASVLAQTVKSVDKRQVRIEQRQSEMLASVRQMRTTLLNLQSEGLSLMGRLHRLDHERQQEDQVVGANGSSRRRGDQGTLLPSCLDYATSSQEAPFPGVRRSGTGVLPAG